MESINGTVVEGPFDELYYFLYPGPHCETLCHFAITTALVIVVVGAVIFVALFAYICISMPSKKAEKEMKAVRIEMRKEWDERKKLKADQESVKVRAEKKEDAKKEETSANGTNRSSSFFHVNFRERAIRFEDDNQADVELQHLTSDNPLRRTVIIAPPDIVIESRQIEEEERRNASITDDTVYLRRSASYDEVYETPRASVASLILSRPNAEDYYSDEEYLDARSAVYESKDALDQESDSDRTLTTPTPQHS